MRGGGEVEGYRPDTPDNGSFGHQECRKERPRKMLGFEAPPIPLRY